jgi:hypothetical protein
MKNLPIAVALLAGLSASVGQPTNNPNTTQSTESPTGDQRTPSTATATCVLPDGTRRPCRVRVPAPAAPAPKEGLFAPWQYDPN